MGIRFVLVLYLALLPSLSRAENSDFVKLYHYVTNERSCAHVGRDELEKIGNQGCYRGPHAKASALSAAFESFNWQAFQVAAQNQVDKNNCITEQISEVLKDPAKNDTWNTMATAAWLGYKKSQLILKKCEKYSRTITPTQIDQKAKGHSKQEDEDAICDNPEVLSLLKQARHIFQYTVPVASSPEMLDAIEKNRHSLINKKTGKPLTDNELLEANLSDLSFINLDLSDGKLKAATKSFLEKVAKERSQTAAILSSKKTDGSFDLNNELKQYIYEDDTLFQTLVNKGLMGSDYQNLGSSTSENLSTGAFCLLMRYEPSGTGELVKLAAETLAAGGVAYKAAKGATAAALEFANATKAAKLKNTLKTAGTIGLVTSGVPMLVHQVATSCNLTLPKKSQKGQSAIKTENMVGLRATSLPKEMGYSTYSLHFTRSTIPSCQKTEDRNLLIHKNSAGFKCVMDTLLGIAPLKYGIPGSLIDIDQ